MKADPIRYAKYLRYSRVHGDQELDSIKNQEKVIDEFVNKKLDRGENWTLHDVYVDVDCSGANFNRPGFLQLKDAVISGNIDVIISKDISRLGRNIATEVYLSELFPRYNTSFIGVSDEVNSGDDKNILERQIKTVMNEHYCRDISNKVRSSFYAMMAEGKYIGSSEPYGFLRDEADKHRLVVDENVKPVILEIVDLYLKGHGFSGVAKILNDKELPPLTPSTYKKARGSNYENKRVGADKWSPSTIRKILTDPIYNGTMVQRKFEKINFKLKTRKETPDEKKIKVENAVEKIIDDKNWDLVQKKIELRSKSIGPGKQVKKSDSAKTKWDEPINVYSGILFCDDCGSKMAYRKDRDLYMCTTYAKYGKNHCSNHHIKTKEINQVIVKVIDILNRLTLKIPELIEDINKINYRKRIRKSEKLENKIQMIQDRIIVIDKTLKVLREEFVEEKISQAEYQQAKQEYQEEKANLNRELDRGLIPSNILQAEDGGFLDIDYCDFADLEKIYKEHFKIETLEKSLLFKIINKIMVGKNKKITKIIFNCKSPF